MKYGNTTLSCIMHGYCLHLACWGCTRRPGGIPHACSGNGGGAVLCLRGQSAPADRSHSLMKEQAHVDKHCYVVLHGSATRIQLRRDASAHMRVLGCTAAVLLA